MENNKEKKNKRFLKNICGTIVFYIIVLILSPFNIPLWLEVCICLPYFIILNENELYELNNKSMTYLDRGFHDIVSKYKNYPYFIGYSDFKEITKSMDNFYKKNGYYLEDRELIKRQNKLRSKQKRDSLFKKILNIIKSIIKIFCTPKLIVLLTSLLTSLLISLYFKDLLIFILMFLMFNLVFLLLFKILLNLFLNYIFEIIYLFKGKGINNIFKYIFKKDLGDCIYKFFYPIFYSDDVNKYYEDIRMYEINLIDEILKGRYKEDEEREKSKKIKSYKIQSKNPINTKI